LDGFYFRGKVLRDARLVRASLREANLTGADLTGADLSQANLSGASLRGANLRGARLRDALLNEADLTGANFLASDLRGADFFSTVLHRTRFTKANFGGATLDFIYVHKTDFRTADLRTAEFGEGVLEQIRADSATYWPSSSNPRGKAGLEDVGCRLARPLKSREGEVATTIRFTNRTSQVVRIYWLNYEGAQELYGYLQPSHSRSFDTYLTHPWVVADGSGDCISTFLPTGKYKEAVISR
jgi:hypothetical protein